MIAKWVVGLVLLPLLVGGAATAPMLQGEEEIVFDAGKDGLSIAELIETASKVTGEPFFFEEKDIKDCRVQFTGRVAVARENFIPFFEHCLRNADYLHFETQVAGRRSHSIQKLGQQARGQQAIKTRARIVTLDELRSMADRQLLVTTTWSGKNLPARELVTTLQIYFADSATESIRNVEGTNSIIMTGHAANLAAVVAMIDRMDAALAEDPGFLHQRNLEERIAKLESAIAQLTRPKGLPEK